MIDSELVPWIFPKWDPSTLLSLWTPLPEVPIQTQPSSSCSIEVIETSPDSIEGILSEMSTGSFQRLSLLSIMSMIVPEAIQNSPASPSSIIAVICASSIEGLLTSGKDPSETSPRILPIVPEESPIIAKESGGERDCPPGQGLMLFPVPERPKSDRDISLLKSKTSVSYVWTCCSPRMYSHPGVTARPIVMSEDSQLDEVQDGTHDSDEMSNLSMPESEVAM